MNVCMYVYTVMYVCMYIYIHIYTHIYIRIHTHTHIYIYVYIKWLGFRFRLSLSHMAGNTPYKSDKPKPRPEHKTQTTP